jgi:hypothetical protein
MDMMYEGVTLDNGLTVKNGEIVTKPDMEAIKAASKLLIEKLNAGPQPARIAREKAAWDAQNKRRR